MGRGGRGREWGVEGAGRRGGGGREVREATAIPRSPIRLNGRWPSLGGAPAATYVRRYSKWIDRNTLIPMFSLADQATVFLDRALAANARYWLVASLCFSYYFLTFSMLDSRDLTASMRLAFWCSRNCARSNVFIASRSKRAIS